jgi:nucleoside-diphosphate-sugar epimerase
MVRIIVTGGSGFIGTNLVSYFLAKGVTVQSLDIAPPRNPFHTTVWKCVDLNDSEAVELAIAGFDPSHVIHLAARTDLRETRDLDAYRSNFRGVANLIDALRGATSLKRVVFASSMLVCRYGYTPKSDTEYCPTTLYGKSKVEGERLLRTMGDMLPWVLIRPTSIWGPWFGEPYKRFFKTVLAGRYVHPRGRIVQKALGFVGNTVAQIASLAVSDLQGILHRTFYLCDTPGYSLNEWVEGIHRAARLGSVRTAPVWLFRVAARCGDLMKTVGYSNPPLTSFRLANMLTPSGFDTTDLANITRTLPFTMDQGIHETLRWLQQERDGKLGATSFTL